VVEQRARATGIFGDDAIDRAERLDGPQRDVAQVPNRRCYDEEYA